MPDPRDQIELSTGIGAGRHADRSADARPWLGLYFRCAGQYARAYRNAAGTAYLGRCPKCGKSVRFVVGQGGTSERMFRVEC